MRDGQDSKRKSRGSLNTQICHTITSAAFYWPKQITRPVKTQGKRGRKTFNDGGAAISEKKNKSYLKYEKELSYDDKDGFIKYIEEKNKEYISSGSRERIKGIWFEDEYKRYYPYNSMACNIIGFSNHDGNACVRVGSREGEGKGGKDEGREEGCP